MPGHRERTSKANIQRLSISIAAWVRKSIISSARCQASRRASKGKATSICTKELWLDLLQASTRSDSSIGRDGGRSIRLRCREGVCSLAAAADISQACAWIAARIRQLGPCTTLLRGLLEAIWTSKHPSVPHRLKILMSHRGSHLPQSAASTNLYAQGLDES